MTELFQPGAVKETEIMHKERPLAEVSDFVVEQLPLKLQAIRERQGNPLDLAAQAEELVATLDSDFLDAVAASPKERDLAALDLKMLETAVVNAFEFQEKDGKVITVNKGVVPGPKLTSMVDRFATLTNQPAVVTYQELILQNPPHDRRTFTIGEAGATEEGFYEAHRVIEGYLDASIVAGLESSKALSDAKIGVLGREEAIALAVERVGSINDRITDINAYMRDLMSKMDPKKFKEFRDYFGGHLIRGVPGDTPTLVLLQPGEYITQEHKEYVKDNNIVGLKGPSGAFTAGFPTIEMILQGDKLEPEYAAYIGDNFMYFPHEGQQGIENGLSLMQQGKTISKLSADLGSPQELTDVMTTTGRLLHRFRGMHYNAVKIHIPEAIAGNVRGSAGETDVAKFLMDRIQMTRRVYNL